MTDLDLYGRIEHWTYPAAMGDCEDYVLLKRRLLRERGWPSSALLITVVRDENNKRYLWCFTEGNRGISINSSETLTGADAVATRPMGSRPSAL